jgi:hypothetical protein
MSEKITKINEAIHECLEHCYCAQLPIACMVEYLDHLRDNPDWDADDVEMVETRVRQILTLIVEQPPSGRISA